VWRLGQFEARREGWEQHRYNNGARDDVLVGNGDYSGAKLDGLGNPYLNTSFYVVDRGKSS
jgi:hypothetical protein